ncbi:hypothetical protein GQ53DRAFT_186101 [Thozetella sp. PMI_491]|nr:hypothetical protein GQ53DRAFT_186101 [Thozetella sp. PMI_491]
MPPFILLRDPRRSGPVTRASHAEHAGHTRGLEQDDSEDQVLDRFLCSTERQESLSAWLVQGDKDPATVTKVWEAANSQEQAQIIEKALFWTANPGYPRRLLQGVYKRLAKDQGLNDNMVVMMCIAIGTYH